MKYVVDALDGIYHIEANKELTKGEVVLYSHENTFDLMKVGKVGVDFDNSIEEQWYELYSKRTWGKVHKEDVVSFRRQNHVKLTESEDENFDRKKHWLLKGDLENLQVDFEARFNKNQMLLVDGKVFIVEEVNNKEKSAVVKAFDVILIEGLYSVKTKEGLKLVKSWGEAYDLRVGLK